MVYPLTDPTDANSIYVRICGPRRQIEHNCQDMLRVGLKLYRSSPPGDPTPRPWKIYLVHCIREAVLNKTRHTTGFIYPPTSLPAHADLDVRVMGELAELIVKLLARCACNQNMCGLQNSRLTSSDLVSSKNIALYPTTRKHVVQDSRTRDCMSSVPSCG